MSGIGFRVQKHSVVLAVPKECYPDESLIPSKEAFMQLVNENTKAVINGFLKVVTVGSAVEFCKVDEMVCMKSHVRPEVIEQEYEGLKYPRIYFVVAEGDLLAVNE